ncbi:uncharacterized protein METZ01_LOCUS377897, partial [marine metagenome]
MDPAHVGIHARMCGSGFIELHGQRFVAERLYLNWLNAMRAGTVLRGKTCSRQRIT